MWKGTDIDGNIKNSNRATIHYISLNYVCVASYYSLSKVVLLLFLIDFLSIQKDERLVMILQNTNILSPPSSFSSSAICFSFPRIAINSCISIRSILSSLNLEIRSLFLSISLEVNDVVKIYFFLNFNINSIAFLIISSSSSRVSLVK
jgi:hypothetical protein